MTRSVELLPTSRELTIALQELGWQQSSEIPGTLSSWIRDSQEVLVPLDPARGDFANLLKSAIDSIEFLHGVTASQVLRRVIQTTRQTFDSSRFLRETPTRGGIIGWLDGRALYDAAEQSLLAAARSARAPRKYHGSASSYLASNVLQSAFMGQTERGSFVVTLLTQPNEIFAASKADEKRRQGQIEFGPGVGVSGRRVLDTLESALIGTKEALNSYRDVPHLDAFGELVPSGVSAELLRAVAAVSQGASESAITIDFSGGEVASRRAEFTFTAEDSPILDRASTRLLEDPDPQDATIIGTINQVSRPRAGEHGVARLRVESGADIKNVRVRIDPEQYSDIVNAHRDDLRLQVAGRLERDRKYYWLYGTTEIRVLDADETAADTWDEPRLGYADGADDED